MSVRPAVRVVILGGGFADVDVATELEQALPRDCAVEITLVNRDNFLLFTPMLHEVAASDLDLTHIVTPIRAWCAAPCSSSARSRRSILRAAR